MLHIVVGWVASRNQKVNKCCDGGFLLFLMDLLSAMISCSWLLVCHLIKCDCVIVFFIFLFSPCVFSFLDQIAEIRQQEYLPNEQV